LDLEFCEAKLQPHHPSDDGASAESGISYGDSAPIAAFATQPGRSALTLIRCSGAESPELLAGIFSAPGKLLAATGNSIVYGWILGPGRRRIDQVLVSVFRAPASYTGENSLEISCHGGTAVGRAVMAVLREAGFRDALPGEFTFRAFLNGKLDLTRCESVMELVSARTDRARGGAVNRLSGTLAAEIDDIKTALVSVLAGVEVFLDYGEDEFDPADPGADLSPLPSLLARLERLCESRKRERIVQEGILAVIAGRPNSGKSSLFNFLLKEERSIVTELAGTTRDWIEATVSLEGIPVRLVDTAGIRDSGDPVESLGVRRSRELLEKADLVLYLLDGGADVAEGITEADLAALAELAAPGRCPCIAVWNKLDLAALPESARRLLPPGIDFLGVSAKTGEGIAGLGRTVATLAGSPEPESPDDGSLATLGTARQESLVASAAVSLKETLELAAGRQPPELVAGSLREAIDLLGEITGEVSTADILQEMFGNFCLGK